MPGVQLLDVSGPLDVFAEANVQAGRPAYRLLVLSSRPGHIRSSSGARLAADHMIGDSFDEPIDTLLIAGCPNASDRFAAARFCSPQPACWTAIV
jgi:transcriptional regulator GlxA family with amidase domain